MAILNQMIRFDGKTEEAFDFYKLAFGTKLTSIMRWKEMPGNNKLSKKDGDKIMHIALPVGEFSLMGSDVIGEYKKKFNEGNNFSIVIQAKSKEEANSLYKKLSNGGKIFMPLSDSFWGSYYAQFHDKFGIEWMINYTYPKKQK